MMSIEPALPAEPVSGTGQRRLCPCMLIRCALSVLQRCRVLASGVAVGLVAIAATASGADVPHRPARIVSLNLCTDELVLRLADRSRIASVTWLAATSSVSNVADLALGIPANHGLAEEIVPLDPDLVVAGRYTARTAVAFLKRAGIAVLDLDVPHTFDEIRAQYRRMGQVLGEDGRAERIIADIDNRLQSIPAVPAGVRPRALVFNANGYTVGKGSLTDEIITRAGMDNLAVTLGIDNYGRIPLETVVTGHVDVLILSSFRDGPWAMATEVLRHPVLTRMSDRMRTAVVPGRLWACAGPGNVDAIALLSTAAREARGKETRE